MNQILLGSLLGIFLFLLVITLVPRIFPSELKELQNEIKKFNGIS